VIHDIRRSDDSQQILRDLAKLARDISKMDDGVVNSAELSLGGGGNRGQKDGRDKRE